MLEAVRQSVPELLPYMLLMYGGTSRVNFSDQRGKLVLGIDMTTGVHQGCALGSAGFAITYARPLDRVRTAFGTASRVLTIYDDATIFPPKGREAEMAKALSTEIARCGLELQWPKCTSYAKETMPQETISQLQDLQIQHATPDKGIIVGGAAVGSDNYERMHCVLTAGKIAGLATRIANTLLDDKIEPLDLGHDVPVRQGVQTLLRLCIPTRFTYTTRTHPRHATGDTSIIVDQVSQALQGAIADFDFNTAAAAADFDGIKYKCLTHFPIKHGGCGVVSQQVAAPAASIGSIVLAAEHIHKTQLLAPGTTPGDDEIKLRGQDAAIATMITAGGSDVKELLDGIAITATPAEQDQGKIHVQKRLLTEIYNVNARRLITAHSATIEGKKQMALHLSCGGDGGAWLTANPTLHHTKMRDDAFIAALRLRLQLPLMHTPGLECNKCHATMDSEGSHAFSPCVGKAAANMRHTVVKDQLAMIVREAGYSASTETPYDKEFQRKVGGAERNVEHKIDVKMYTPNGVVAVDVTGHDPRSSTFATAQAKAHTERGGTCAAAEKRKVKELHARYVVPAGSFLTLAFETGGLLGEDAKKLLRALAKAKTGGLPGAQYGYWYRTFRARISVAIQRGNATAVHIWNKYCVPAHAAAA